LYPAPRTAPGRYCAPRLAEGFVVAAARRRIALRAGLLRAADGERVGALRGHIDEASAHRIVGWAQSVDHPGASVCLDIFVDGELTGQVLANRYREDLERAGIGGGYHGFLFVLPAGATFGSGDIEIRRSLDGAALPLSTDVREMQPLT